MTGNAERDVRGAKQTGNDHPPAPPTPTSEQSSPVPPPPPVPEPSPPVPQPPPPPPPDQSFSISPPRTPPPPLEPPAIDEDDPSSERQEQQTAFWLFTAIPSGLLSTIAHLMLLIALGACVIATQIGGDRDAGMEVIVTMESEEDEEEIEESLEVVELAAVEPEVEPLQVAADDTPPPPIDEVEPEDPFAAQPPLDVFADRGPPAGVTGLGGGGEGGPVAARQVSAVGAQHLAARSRRRQYALQHGASPDSEKAVDWALEWIVRHQQRTGAWNFNHRQGPHDCSPCTCRDPGGHPGALAGATALGLLPLLGAGNTPREGRHQEAVARGLRYLIARQKPTGSFHESGGRMYSHGLAALALCEALAMIQYSEPAMASEAGPDRIAGARYPSATPRRSGDFSDADVVRLRKAAQRALQFIEQAQHNQGGWRYSPKQAGDTSVVGWQMMALTSGKLAGLYVQPATIKRATRFLDRVSYGKLGDAYGYASGSKTTLPPSSHIRATTPIGLLCRMYTGWNRARPGIRAGVTRLRRWARPNQGMYFYYYATQVMHHYGGQPWQHWNAWMRDHLVRKQNTTGSERGSWKLGGRHDDSGRLYCTAMAAMTLEVYYRHSPIYGEGALTGDLRR